MTLNQSMNIALNSMKNNQYALTVVSHNIANLNTEGYHKQRVNFSENILELPNGCLRFLLFFIIIIVCIILVIVFGSKLSGKE